MYVPLGRSGLQVSRICLGAMNFGSSDDAPCSEADARRIIDAYLDAGHNFIDTANVYRGGESEEVVGRAIKGRRDSVVVASKAYHPQGDGPNDRGLSRAHLTLALEATLRRIGTDYLDLYQCHLWDATTPIEETMSTLDGFIQAGKVRYVGCSNFSAAQIVEAQWAAQRAGGTGFVSSQSQYSLLARDIESEIAPTCERHGLGLLAYSPLASGMLTGKYRRAAPPPAGTRLNRLLDSATALAKQWSNTPPVQRMIDQTFAEASFEVVDELSTVAREQSTTATAAAIAWLLRRPAVTSVIIGPRTFEQYSECLQGAVVDLPPDALSRLDDVSRPADALINGVALSRRAPS